MLCVRLALTWNFLYTAVSLTAMYIDASHARSVSTWNFTMAEATWKLSEAALGHASRKKKLQVANEPPGAFAVSVEAYRATRVPRSLRYRNAALASTLRSREGSRRACVWPHEYSDI